MAVATRGGGYIERPKPSGLADVLEVLLDKGLVIDLYLRVSLIGIEILTVDARIVVASVDTYLRFAEAVGRLNIEENDQSEGLPQLIESMTSGGAESKTKGAIEGIKDKLFGDDDDDETARAVAVAAAADSAAAPPHVHRGRARPAHPRAPDLVPRPGRGRGVAARVRDRA